MQITQIRNATLKLHYANKTFLIDPMLAHKNAYPGFVGTVNSATRYPTVELPIPINDILATDMVIITHTHADHWDAAAINLIDKHQLIFVQNSNDKQIVNQQGFDNVNILHNTIIENDITLIRTSGQHGNDEIINQLGDRMGEVSGVIFQHKNEKTVYIVGDSIWNEDIKNTINQYQPDIIIINCGDAKVLELGSIIMGKEDLLHLYHAAPQAVIIASHMEAVNHATLSRAELNEFILARKMTDRVLIPTDGQSYLF